MQPYRKDGNNLEQTNSNQEPNSSDRPTTIDSNIIPSVMPPDQSTESGKAVPQPVGSDVPSSANLSKDDIDEAGEVIKPFLPDGGDVRVDQIVDAQKEKQDKLKEIDDILDKQPGGSGPVPGSGQPGGGGGGEPGPGAPGGNTPGPASGESGGGPKITDPKVEEENK